MHHSTSDPLLYLPTSSALGWESEPASLRKALLITTPNRKWRTPKKGKLQPLPGHSSTQPDTSLGRSDRQVADAPLPECIPESPLAETEALANKIPQGACDEFPHGPALDALAMKVAELDKVTKGSGEEEEALAKAPLEIEDQALTETLQSYDLSYSELLRRLSNKMKVLSDEMIQCLNSAFLRQQELSDELLQCLNAGLPSNMMRAMPHIARLSEVLSDTMDLETENIKLRKQLHQEACEAEQERVKLKKALRDLAQKQAEVDEYRIKYENVLGSEQKKSLELMEERRKNDELTKQVREMCENLLTITSSEGGNNQGNDMTGLRKRCFKLVRTNTGLSSQLHLVKRQKGWAQAKAKVLQDELTRVYMGILDGNVKTTDDIEQAAQDQYDVQATRKSSHNVAAGSIKPYKPLCQLPDDHKEASVDFLTHLTQTGGHELKSFLNSATVYCDAIRDQCLDTLGQEFYYVQRRSDKMVRFVRNVQKLVNLSDTSTAIPSFTQVVTDLLECDRATVWVVDLPRRTMWTQVPDKTMHGSVTLQLPLPKPNTNPNQESIGIVASAYLSQQSLVIADAHEDKRFNKEAEKATGYRTQSMLCFPIVRHGKVRVVLQAINKLKRPTFDEDDIFTLQLLGHVASEVLMVCETQTSSSSNDKRKDLLLLRAKSLIVCNSPVQLVHSIIQGLQDLFEAEATALHLVYTDYTSHLCLDRQGKHVAEVKNESGFRGLIGQAVLSRTTNAYHTIHKEQHSSYDRNVDLPLPMGREAVLHTIPFFTGNVASLVCQFVCKEKERTGFGDDGNYNALNTTHVKLLNHLISYALVHIERWYPIEQRHKDKWAPVETRPSIMEHLDPVPPVPAQKDDS